MKKTLSFSKPLPEKLVAFKEEIAKPRPLNRFPSRFQKKLALKKAGTAEFEFIFYLNEHFSKVFSKDSPLPLKANIHNDLFPLLPADKGFTKKVVRRGLYLICKSPQYLQAIVTHQKRYDLMGNVVEDIIPEHIETAQKALSKVPQK